MADSLTLVNWEPALAKLHFAVGKQSFLNDVPKQVGAKSDQIPMKHRGFKAIGRAQLRSKSPRGGPAPIYRGASERAGKRAFIPSPLVRP